MADFFIKRPILSFCLSIIIVLLGAFSILRLPVSEYPDIIPPSIQVTATYPGADCETVVKSIASPIEQQMSGVDGMSYMTSVNTNNGQMSMMILFETGTEANMDQVLSYLRYGQATSQLPPEVSELGISLRKTSGCPPWSSAFIPPTEPMTACGWPTTPTSIWWMPSSASPAWGMSRSSAPAATPCASG